MKNRIRPIAAVVSVLLLPAVFAGCQVRIKSYFPSDSDSRKLQALVDKNLADPRPREPLKQAPPGVYELNLIQRIPGRYFMDATINGSKLDLMLDWGGGVTLGLTPNCALSVKARLSDQRTEIPMVDLVDSLRLGMVSKLDLGGGLAMADVPILMSNENRDLVMMGFLTVYRGKGLVGLPLIAPYRKFAIDLRENRLYLGKIPQALLDAKDRREIPVEFREGMLFITLKINGAPREVVVDIGGSVGCLTLAGEPARQHMAGRKLPIVGTTTGTGRKQLPLSMDRNVHFEGGNFEGTVDLHLAPDSPQKWGAVGNAFFDYGIVGVDLDAGNLFWTCTSQ